MDLVKMAFRNVWRNKRRTIVTVAAMSLALFVMILYSSLVTGYLMSIEKNLLDMELGEIQIHANGYQTEPSIYKKIDNVDAVEKHLEAKGFKASSRLLGAGLAAVRDTSAGASFIGIDVEKDRVVSRIYKNVSKGAWLDPAHPNEVVVGGKMAKNLNATIGDELVVLSQGADGSMANALFKIRGILRAVTDAVDRSGIFMTEAAFRDLMVFETGAHRMIVRSPTAIPLDQAHAIAKQSAPGLDVKTWREVVPTLASMMDSSKGVMFTMFFIIYIAIGIVILNAMLMAVFERIREFGVLKAIGVTPSSVLRLIFIEGTVQTVLAIVIGGSLSLPGLWYLQNVGIDMRGLGGMTIQGIVWDPIWRGHVETSTFTDPVITLVVVVSMALLYPALKAAAIRPVQAMHHR